MNARTAFALDVAPNPLRECALVLHSMEQEDRKWLLAHLNGGLVSELERLVCELQALGIPADPAAAQNALERRRSVRMSAQPVLPTQPPSTGAVEPERARARELAGLLRDQPDGLVARVLAEREPLERKTVLNLLHAVQRRRVAEWTSLAQASGWSVRLAPRSAQAVEEHVSRRLAARISGPVVSLQPVGPLTRALCRLRLLRAWS
jgi:hypothetical protein